MRPLDYPIASGKDMPRSWDERELRLMARMILIVTAPKQLTREDKKKAGLRYCRYAGYGYRWARNKRVPDQHEQEVIALIFKLRSMNYSWYQIAAHLLHNHIKTKEGREWSPSRVR